MIIGSPNFFEFESPSFSSWPSFLGRSSQMTGVALALSYRDKERSKRDRERSARKLVELRNGAKARREG
jgi:hypothetical protein